jgi:phosphoribosylglycinamide formyltransferase-1
VLASGSGSNFQAIAEYIKPPHQIALLISDKPQAYALKRADVLGIPSLLVPYIKGEPRTVPESKITHALHDAGCDLIVLAGYMKVFTPSFVENWEGKLINIHPASSQNTQVPMVSATVLIQQIGNWESLSTM